MLTSCSTGTDTDEAPAGVGVSPFAQGTSVCKDLTGDGYGGATPVPPAERIDVTDVELDVVDTTLTLTWRFAEPVQALPLTHIITLHTSISAPDAEDVSNDLSFDVFNLRGNGWEASLRQGGSQLSDPSMPARMTGQTANEVSAEVDIADYEPGAYLDDFDLAGLHEDFKWRSWVEKLPLNSGIQWLWMDACPGAGEPTATALFVENQSDPLHDPSQRPAPTVTSEPANEPPGDLTAPGLADLTRGLDALLTQDWETALRSVVADDPGGGSEQQAMVIGNYWAIADYCRKVTNLPTADCYEAAGAYLSDRVGGTFGPYSEAPFRDNPSVMQGTYNGYIMAGSLLGFSQKMDAVTRPGFPNLT